MGGIRPQTKNCFNVSTQAILAYMVNLNETSPGLRPAGVSTKKTALASQLAYPVSLIPYPISSQVGYQQQKLS